MDDSTARPRAQQSPVESIYPEDDSRFVWDDAAQRWAQVGETSVAKHFRKIDQHQTPRPVAIRPFVRLGDCFFLVGERGQGKTTFAADLLRAYGYAAAGNEETDPSQYLFGGGAFEVVPQFFRNRPAVILDAENEPSDWIDALSSTLRAYGRSWQEPEMKRFRSDLLYHLDSTQFPLCPMSYPREHKKTREALVDELRRRNAGLLIIDPLHAVYGRRGVEKPDWAREGLEPLRHDLRQFDCNLLLLAHPSRYYPDKPWQNVFLPLGTGAQEGLADVIVGIWRPPQSRDKNIVKLELVKRRAAKWNLERTHAVLRGTRFDAGYSGAQSEWTFEDHRKAKGPDVYLSPGEQRLLLGCPTGEFTYADLDSSLSRSWASRTIRGPFVTHGIVQCLRGSGRKGDPFVWILSERGRELRRWAIEENRDLAREMGVGPDGENPS